MLKKIYNNHKETIHNFIWRSLQIFGKQGITFLIFILCAKLLTPYDFGLYNYALAIIFFFIIFGDFGISAATSKYVAEYNAINKDKLKLVLFNSGIVIVGLTIIITILTLLIGPWYLKDKYIYVLYLLPLIFLAPMTSLYDGIYRGLKKFKQLAILSLIVGVLSIPFVYLLVKQYGLIGALIAQNLFYFILLINLAFSYREFHLKFNKEVMKEVGKYSIIIGISSIAFFLYSRADIIILGHFGYIKEIGYYGVIIQVFNIMVIPLTLLAQVISPNITSNFAKKEYDKIREKLNYFMKLVIPISILIAIIFYFLFPEIIRILLPKYYIKEMLISITILSFLIPTKIWGVFQTQSFIVSTGYAKIIAVTTLIGGVLNVIFDIILIKLIGFTGVFWVTLIIHSLNIIFQTSYYKHKIKSLK